MTEFLRRPQHLYQDPLDRVWIACAEHIGFRIERSAEVYASTDGRGTVLIGTDEILDPDDCLAQMILHELCHALVEGEAGETQVDWGLDNISKHHRWREHACLRLQAYLADSAGLRDFFAPTTDFRVTFWTSLPIDPLWASREAGGRREPSCVAARAAVWRAAQPRWAAPLRQALAASAAIARWVPGVVKTDKAAMPSLWATAGLPAQPHPGGHSTIAAYHASHRCGDCAWWFSHHRRSRCRHAPEIAVAGDTPACARWEPQAELDCQTCGACCREAYDAVELAPREEVIRRHPDLVVKVDGRNKLRREAARCAALLGGNSAEEVYSCRIYPDRPRTCRDFTRGSEHCLEARRKVGLSI